MGRPLRGQADQVGLIILMKLIILLITMKYKRKVEKEKIHNKKQKRKTENEKKNTRKKKNTQK